MNSNCIFCRIIAGEIPSEKVYEDDSVMAFLDIKPVSRGHVLVIPKNHSADLLSADNETLKDLMPKVKQISQAVMKAVNAQGINVSTNNGAAAGQIIFHLHFHLIPRYSKDGLPPWPHHEVELKTRTELAEKIKEKFTPDTITSLL